MSEHISSLAVAYADREFKEDECLQRSIRFFAGTEFKPTSEEEKQTEITENALRIDKMLRRNNWDSRMQIHLEYQTTQLASQLSLQLAPHVKSLPPSTLTQASELMAKAAMNVIYAPLVRRAGEDIPLFCSAATKIGQERGIKPESVFEEDTLYEEMVGQTYKPQDYLRPIIQTAQSLTLDICTRVIAFGIKPFVNIDAPEGEEMEEVRRMLISYPGFGKGIDQVIYPNKTAYFKWAWKSLGRFWKPEAFDTLPEDIMIILINESSRVSLEKSN